VTKSTTAIASPLFSAKEIRLSVCVAPLVANECINPGADIMLKLYSSLFSRIEIASL
jgi:hypothetical protein